MRKFKRTTWAASCALALTLVASACSGSDDSSKGDSGGGGSSGADVVNLAFNADMQVPDPDIFYEIEGNSVTTSVYEGLVRYKPDSTETEGALAETFEVTPDGLTYTFHLRSGVTFHDGTPMDAAAVQASFERRTDVNSAPAYMLADVASYATPDATTFVVTLAKPVSAFLDYLAAPYGPKVISPTILKDHGGSDFGQEYLKTHDAGTGPFQMSEFVPGEHYTLTRFDDYWGGAAEVSKIRISIVPDISTQRLMLESGELSMIIHGLSLSDVESLGKKDDLQVQRFPALFKSLLFVNENKSVFKDQKVRQALLQAIDKKAIAEQVYGENGKVSTQFLPAGELPDGMGMDDAAYDPGVLKALVAGLSDKKVDLAYSSDDARNQRGAELVQTELSALGLDVTTRAIPIAQVFDLPNQPDQAPDLLYATVNPDAAHPDTWVRIFANTAGALNWLQCSVPEADAAMDVGLAATAAADVQAAYAKSADALVASGCYVNIADVQEVIVANKAYTGFVHQLPTLFTIRFGDLQVSG
jgi:peptide/nickel transport system substrate-binding protein